MRALDEAFELVPPGVLPRSRADFDARVATGQRRVDAALAEWGKLAELVAVLVDEARTRTKAMRGQPGAPKASLDDMTSQLDALAPHDLFLEVPRERLLHYPRYLRAVSVRLDRLPNGPQKDLSKMAEVAPLWSELLSRREALAKRGVPSSEIDACRWLVEELRVSVFAPELRAAVSVSPARVAEVLRDLARRA
jgi:ATP-dependent helicase HrpA